MPPNWNSLLEQGRCKAIGVPWNEEEHHAVTVLNIPAEFVREGILTIDEYDEVKGSSERRFKKRGELMNEAKSLGLEYSRKTTNLELIQMIEVAERKKEVKETAQASQPSEAEPPAEEGKAESNQSPESPEPSVEGQE